MSDLLIAIFRYFDKRKALLFILMGGLFAITIFLASQISFEEDISQTISGKDQHDLTGRVVKNLPITDKIIIDISLTDSSQPANPEMLENIGEILADSLKAEIDTSLIKSLTFRASDSTMLTMMDIVITHLPTFLDASDYQRLDSMIQPESVKKAMEANYRILQSPASMVLKKRIQHDPLGISNLGLVKLKSLQAGGNFELRNGCIFSADLRHLLIFIVPVHPLSETSQNDKLISKLDDVITKTNNDYKEKAHIQYFGGAAVAVANARQIKKDITLTLVLSLLLIFGLTGWYFRSFRVRILGMLPAIFGGTMAIAILFLAKGKISAISLGIGSVLLGLIVDYSLYLINHYKNKGSIEQSLKDMWVTILMCSFTTIGAFLCLTFLSSSVLHDLGWFAALSVAGATFFTLFFLPHLFGNKIIAPPNPSQETFIDRIAGIRFEQKRWLIALLLAAGVASLYFARKVEFEKNMGTLNFVTPELAKAEKDLDRISNYKLANIYLVAIGNTYQSALSSKEKLSVEVQRLINEGLIHGKSDAGSLLMSDSLQKIKIAHWNRFWTKERRANLDILIKDEAQKAGFRAEAFKPFNDLLNRSFNPLAAEEVQGRTNNLFGDWLTQTGDLVLAPTVLQIQEANKEKIYQAFSGNSNFVLFDKQSLTTQFVLNVKQDFDLLVTLSMLFVTLLLIFSLGRIGLGLITAIPMYLSWLITLGVMGITGITFNIFNIIISSFIFGLGVDYSILMMRGLQQQLITGKDEMKNFKVTVVLSSLTTLFGVGALFAARHPALNSIALISVIGIILVVIISFTILPLIFNELILSKNRRSKFPVTLWILIRTVTTWGNIVSIAIILMILGGIIKLLLPIPQKKKERLFHQLFYWSTKLYISITFPFDHKLINENGENFRKPAIIISNHQSLIETPAFLRLYPKILILTTSWVYRSPIFGPIARLANFFNVDLGIENLVKPLKKKVLEGYSILIFPEGHRSEDGRIQRFHRGAFFLAEKLQIDILPMMVFGSGDFLGRGAFWGRPNSLRMKVMPRVAWYDESFGKTYQERARQFRQFYVAAYAGFKSAEGDAHYYKRTLALNYVLKGPVLEWYMRVKLKLENNYDIYCKLLPRTGEILDLGCGYGFISYMLMLTSEDRRITGIDYDQEKIIAASNGFSKNDRISFVCADVSDVEITPKSGFLLSDVLHYLSSDHQELLLRKCFSNLLPGGTILIREANADLETRHQRSKLTELFSTRTGFNKTATSSKELHFTSASQIEAIAKDYGLALEVIDNKKLTSNNLFVIKKLQAT